VIPEIDIWRAANLMLKRYGDKALDESAMRADELAAGGDHDGATTWRRIARLGLLFSRPVRRSGRNALALDFGHNTQLMGRPVLAATYGQLNKLRDADRERTAAMRLSPFFDAERFAGQFGTQEARDHMLDGLKKAGFR
jgi:hypothetical protein